MRCRLFVLCALVLLDGGCHPRVAVNTKATPFYMLPWDATDEEHFCVGPENGHGPTLRCITVGELRRLVWSLQIANDPEPIPVQR